MLQRIQTIYILLFSILLFIASFLPFAIVTLGDDFYSLYPATGWEISSGETYSDSKTFYYVGYLVAVSFSVLMLVNYKNRKKQLRYGKICYLIVLLSLVYMFNVVSQMTTELEAANAPQYSYSMYLLVASLPFMFLANRAIKKDEKLVKSLDRLR